MMAVKRRRPGGTKDIDHVIVEIEETLSRLQAKRKAAQRRARFVFLTQVVLIFLTTVLLGLSFPGFDQALANAALVTSAGATLTATIAGYFNFRDRWVEHTQTVSQLHGLLGDARALRLNPNGTREQEPATQLRQRLRRVLDESTQRWVGIKYVEPAVPSTSGGIKR